MSIIKYIVFTALSLSLFVVAKLVQSFIPDLPNGLGNLSVLIELFIIFSSLIFGWKVALSATFLYIGGIAWISPSLFMSGILWVTEPLTISGVYFLDYFIPLIILSLSGLFISFKPYSGKRRYLIIVFVLFLVLLNYVSHVLSGIIFWGEYAWTGWGVWAYSLAANGIVNGTMAFLAAIATLGAMALKPYLRLEVGYT